MSLLQLLLDNTDDILIEASSFLLRVAAHALSCMWLWTSYLTTLSIKLEIKTSWSILSLRWVRLCFNKVFLIRQRIGSELLGLLLWSLLAHILSHRKSIWLGCRHSILVLHAGITHRMRLCHMEHWRSLGRIVDDIVVYVIVVDDIGNVSTTTLFSTLGP